MDDSSEIDVRDTSSLDVVCFALMQTRSFRYLAVLLEIIIKAPCVYD